MTLDELRECVYRLNPTARFSVWQDSPASEPYIVWENGHTGSRPTVKECGVVLADVQKDMDTESKIRAEKKRLITENDIALTQQAITNLTVKGELTVK